jgi:hypothetical protein
MIDAPKLKYKVVSNGALPSAVRPRISAIDPTGHSARIVLSLGGDDDMHLNNFATLQRGDRIRVKMYRADNQVMTVTGEPFEGNTLVPVIDETGKQYSVYFRDVLNRLEAL